MEAGGWKAFGGTEMSQLVNGEESEGPKEGGGFSENEEIGRENHGNAKKMCL